MEIGNATRARLRPLSQFPRFFFPRSHFRFGRKGAERGTERARQRTKRERVNPESHGNLATSAIGRTCTRSNLKARSRTREKERARAILSFVRAQCASYVRTLVPFIDRARCFLFAVRHLRRELEAPPGAPAEVLSL